MVTSALALQASPGLVPASAFNLTAPRFGTKIKMEVIPPEKSVKDPHHTSGEGADSQANQPTIGFFRLVFMIGPLLMAEQILDQGTAYSMANESIMENAAKLFGSVLILLGAGGAVFSLENITDVLASKIKR